MQQRLGRAHGDVERLHALQEPLHRDGLEASGPAAEAVGPRHAVEQVGLALARETADRPVAHALAVVVELPGLEVLRDEREHLRRARRSPGACGRSSGRAATWSAAARPPRGPGSGSVRPRSAWSPACRGRGRARRASRRAGAAGRPRGRRAAGAPRRPPAACASRRRPRDATPGPGASRPSARARARSRRSMPHSATSASPSDGRRAFKQQLLDLAEDPVGGQLAKRHRGAEPRRSPGRPGARSARRTARARSARSGSSPKVAASTARSRRASRSGRPPQGSRSSPRRRVVEHRVDREVAAPRRFLDGEATDRPPRRSRGGRVRPWSRAAAGRRRARPRRRATPESL